MPLTDARTELRFNPTLVRFEPALRKARVHWEAKFQSHIGPI